MIKANKGFSLIELLMVIAVIGILSAIVLTSLSIARNKAKEATTKIQMKDFEKMVIAAQGEASEQIKDITVSVNTAGESTCASPNDLRGVSNSCYTKWMESLNEIITAGNLFTNNGALDRDAWGSPFLLDENEGETSGPENCECRYDVIASAGPNGIFESATSMSLCPGATWNTAQTFSGDDFGLFLQRYNSASCQN